MTSEDAGQLPAPKERKEAVKNTASQTDKDVLDDSSSDDSLPSFAALQAARSSKKRYGNSKAWTHPNPIVRDDDSEPSKADFETLQSLRASLKAKRKSAAMRKKVSRSSKAKPTSMSRANIMLSPTPRKKATTFLDPDGSDSSLSSAPDSLRSESSTPQVSKKQPTSIFDPDYTDSSLSAVPESLQSGSDILELPKEVTSTVQSKDKEAAKPTAQHQLTSSQLNRGGGRDLLRTKPTGPKSEDRRTRGLQLHQDIQKLAKSGKRGLSNDPREEENVQEKMDSLGDEVDLQDGMGVRDAVHAMDSIEVTKSSPKADQGRGGLAALTSKSHEPSDTIAVIPACHPSKQTIKPWNPSPVERAK
jgi:hypothetical protein